MGLRDLFRGTKCFFCGIKVDDPSKIAKELSHTSLADSLMLALIMMRAPSFICNKCNSKICYSCRNKTWQNYPKCPKCGSEMENFFNKSK
jgi:hypothetical protein